MSDQVQCSTIAIHYGVRRMDVVEATTPVTQPCFCSIRLNSSSTGIDVEWVQGVRVVFTTDTIQYMQINEDESIVVGASPGLGSQLGTDQGVHAVSSMKTCLKNVKRYSPAVKLQHDSHAWFLVKPVSPPHMLAKTQ